MSSMFTRPIVIGLSPNTTSQDYTLTLKTLLSPGRWKLGSARQEAEAWFRNYLDCKTAVSFNAGRSALLAILKSLEIGNGDEVMVQAFTCVAVPNSVLWAGATPIYIDIDATLNLNVTDAQKKFTPKTRALIVQHTFGVPAAMDKIVAFCKAHNIILIEDCAHALGAAYKEQRLGTFGTAAFFSFGRDKVVSSVWGGMAVTNDPELGRKITAYHDRLSMPGAFWIFCQLLHPLVSAIALATYNLIGIGKAVLWLFQKLHLISFPVYSEEKKGKRPADFPKQFPNGLAILALAQLARLSAMNDHRQAMSDLYESHISAKHYILPNIKENRSLLRFTLLTPRADELRFRAKKQGIILGNWYSQLIDPKGTDLTAVKYISGSCPTAERAAREAINLPTYPTLTDMQAKRIISLLAVVE